MARTALVTGITGQDGAYLSQLLLDKGYRVFGAFRRGATLNLWRLNDLGISSEIEFIPMELLEYSNVRRAIEEIAPDEIYNLGAQSFIGVSFEQPLFTSDVNALGVTRILESIREVNPGCKFYQASTSEMYGAANSDQPIDEQTPFCPRSPYALAKLYGHWITSIYRERYNLFACSGILFNHESPLRGAEFVTRKITAGFARIHNRQSFLLQLGNLNARRDWGFAGDYVEGMWRMLQQDRPDDYVLATGTSTSVKEFCELAAQMVDVELVWEGEGFDKIGIDRRTGQNIISVDPKFYRPAEADTMLGNASKARTKLAWSAKTSLPQLVEMMMNADLRRLRSGQAFF